MTDLPPLRPHPHLYEINTWLWLEELSRRQDRRVTLAQVPDREWDRLCEMGFDLVWLMGIWRRSPEGRRIAQTDPRLFAGYEAALPGWQPEDIVGSPYAVQAYEPDPRMGTWEEVDSVRARLHARGMRLVLDFVPNHTARDHPWITAHPEYYVHGDDRSLQEQPTDFFLSPGEGAGRPIAHGRDPYFPPWSDTAQLNYLNPATQAAMIGELRRIGQHCDGVRCDMAMLALTRIFLGTWGHRVGSATAPAREFWVEAREAAPGLLLMAEVYWDLEWELQQLGFDFTYDKRLYDRMREGRAPDIAGHLGADMEYQRKLVRFLENHDEPRSAQVFGADKVAVAATLVATLPGMRFYHQGQLVGRRLRPPVQLARAADEPADDRCVDLYARLLRLTDGDPFHDGAWRLLHVGPAGDHTSEHLLAYEWRRGADWKIVVINLAPTSARGRLLLPGDDQDRLGDAAALRFVDELSGEGDPSPVLCQSGLEVSLEVQPSRSHLFAVQ